MIKIIKPLPACLLTLVGLFATADAWSMRCKSYVIDTGMPKMEVVQKCGEPSSRDTRTERRTMRVRESQRRDYNKSSVEVEREIEITVDEWIYNFGPNQFMQQLIFENGKVVQIRDLGYGN